MIFLVVPSVAASGFPREREQGNLDFLRGTWLTSGEILTGKFWGAVYSGLGVYSAALWTLPAIAVLEVASGPWENDRSFLGHPDRSLSGLMFSAVLVLTVSLIFAAALSTTVSTFARRSLSSLGLSFFLLLSLLVLWPMFLVLTGSDGSMEEVLGVTHPFVALGYEFFQSQEKVLGYLIAFFACYSVAISLLWGIAHESARITHERDE